MDEIGRIEAHLREFCAIDGRFAGTDGERRALAAVQAHVPEGMAARVEGFVGSVAPELVVGMLAVALLWAGALGTLHPLCAAFLGGALLAMLVGETTGLWTPVRAVLPGEASYNLVVPLTAADAVGTVVITTPLDAPRWRQRGRAWIKRPIRLLAGAGAGMVALLVLRALADPWGRATASLYAAALVTIAGSGLLMFLVRRRPGDGREDGSGLAASLALMARLAEEPLDGVATWFVFTGSGRANQDGMRAFLEVKGRALPRPLLVLSLVEPGAAPVRAAVSEGRLFSQRHRPTGPALIERMRWAGVTIPEVDRPEPTDARQAMLLGHRAVALVGGEDATTARTTAQAVDIAETMLRWYAEDLHHVAVERPGLEGLARATEREPTPNRANRTWRWRLPRRLRRGAGGEGA